jgi:signal transduction histidine kinase/streptogramin lyase
MSSSHWIVSERFASFVLLTLWLFVNPLPAIATVADEYFLTTWSPKDGLPHEVILGITQTPDGYLWVATAAGLARFDGARFKIAPFENGTQTGQEKIKAIQCDANGTLWIVLDSGSVLIGKAGRFAILSPELGSSSAGAHGVYMDDRRQIILSDRAGSVFHLLDDRLQPWLDTRAIASPDAFAGINVETDGTVWVRHGRTLSWWTGNHWEQLRSPNAEGEVFEALKTGPSRNGGMWISSRTGLRRFRKGHWEARQLNYARSVDALQAVFEDSRGNVWVTFGFDGLIRFDPEGRRETFGAEEGLSHHSVRHLFEDAEGNLWLGTEGGGLMRLRPKPFLANGASLPEAVRLPWTTPRVIVEEVWADSRLRWERPFPASATKTSALKSSERQVILPATTTIVEVQAAALSFGAPGPFRVQSRLRGLDRDWIDSGTNYHLGYTNLAPGRYELQIRAAGLSGLWSEPSEAFAFRVNPHFWQTWTFRLLAGGAAALGLLSWHRVHVKQLERQHALEQTFSRRLIESQEVERQRIAAELHDSLGQKLLIIKNSAQLGLRDSHSGTGASDQLRDVSQTASECLDEIRQIARNLRPYQLDQMGLTKAVRSLACALEQSSGLKVRLDMDELDGLFPHSAEINVYRILQEALNNVLHHAKASEVLLRIERLGREVEILISDNGQGMALASADGPVRGEGGFGLTNMRQRVQILGGKLNIQSGPGLGTKLIVRLPIVTLTATHEG